MANGTSLNSKHGFKGPDINNLKKVELFYSHSVRDHYNNVLMRHLQTFRSFLFQRSLRAYQLQGAQKGIFRKITEPQGFPPVQNSLWSPTIPPSAGDHLMSGFFMRYREPFGGSVWLLAPSAALIGTCLGRFKCTKVLETEQHFNHLEREHLSLYNQS